MILASIDDVKFNEQGLVTVIAQDVVSKKVRMQAYMNREALEKTMETGYVHYYSRSRKELWKKGETSGHFQLLKAMSLDCDGDSILLQIEQVGNISCHTGEPSCFHRTFDAINTKEVVISENNDAEEALSSLYDVIKDRREHPKSGSYTNYLFEQGNDKILKKMGEETTEVVIATKNGKKEEIVSELSDLLYQLSVLMVNNDITWSEINVELNKRK